MTECIKICEWFEQAHQFLLTVGQRRLVILTGELTWSNAIAKSLLTRFKRSKNDQSHLRWQAWGGDFTAEPNAIIKNFSHHLGTENDLVFYADPNFHADAFAALSGTIVAGGLMVWFCPDIKEYKRLIRSADQVFINRIWQQARADEAVYFISPEHTLPQLPSVKKRLEHVSFSLESSALKGCLTQEQQSAVTAIMKVVTGHRKRPLVLTADRGRGKSTALAIAVAHLLLNANQQQSIVITAPHQQALDVFFDQLQRNCELGHLQQQTFHYLAHTVKFVAVDQLLKAQPKATVLLIDEAAAIPVYLLSQLVDNYTRVVFSSTLHGYEGAGRGFSVKFLPLLKDKCPNFNALHIKQPIRWAMNDGLENFVFNSFLLAATHELSQEQVTEIVNEPFKFSVVRISQEELLTDEQLLTDVFAVLVTAHYQTSPSDLKLLLTNSQIRIFVTFYQKKIVAVALTVIEGKVSAKQVCQVAQSQRRLKDQFLPQSLYLHNGVENAFDFSYLRIMRIAVHPKVQGNGLGTALLAKIKDFAVEEQFDILGTSFGATTALMSFWFNAQFSIVRIGFTCDKASGEHSALLVQALNEKSKGQIDNITAEYYKSFNFYLAEQFQQLSPCLVSQIIQQWPKLNLPKLTQQDEKSVVDYISKKRLFTPCLFSLNLWLLHYINGSENKVADFLIARILQRNSTEEVCTTFGFSGKKSLEQASIDAIKDLFLQK